MLALDLAKTIFSFYLILAAGFLLVKTRLLRAEDSRVLSMVTLYLVMPCLIIYSYQIEMQPEIRTGLLLAIVAAVAVHVVEIGILSPLLRKIGFDPLECTSIIYSNCGNLIVPLVFILFGQEYVIYCSAYISIQNILIWSHGRALLGSDRKLMWGKILLNPNNVASVIGATMFFAGWKLPYLVGKSLTLVSGTIVPLSMIVLGMLLSQLDWSAVRRYPKLFPVIACRLIGLPLLFLVILHYFPWDFGLADANRILLVTYLAVIAPPANTVTMMAQIYDRDAVYANAIGVIGTLCCIATMPLLVHLYQLWS